MKTLFLHINIVAFHGQKAGVDRLTPVSVSTGPRAALLSRVLVWSTAPMSSSHTYAGDVGTTQTVSQPQKSNMAKTVFKHTV